MPLKSPAEALLHHPYLAIKLKSSAIMQWTHMQRTPQPQSPPWMGPLSEFVVEGHVGLGMCSQSVFPARRSACSCLLPSLYTLLPP